jgi:hypothetical protein
MSIYLRAGETITVTQDQTVAGEYFIGIDTDFNPFNGNNPIPVGTFGWEYVTSEGSISYTATGDGVIFIGTGFPAIAPSASPLGSVTTSISVDSSGTIGVADFVGGDGDGIFYGGPGDDTYAGGAGSDRFMFTDAATDGDDTILDFQTTLGGGTDNDVIDLDALFDALGVVNIADREVLVDDSSGSTVLTIGDGSGGAHAGAANFSITLDGITGYTEAQLVGNGNVDVS